MDVALYLRRSTDEVLQKFSLQVQEELLRKYAEQRGDTVVAVYGDSASGRTAENRTGFQELLSVVSRGAAFKAVLVRDVSRWGRFQDLDESAYWDFFCRYHGVRVVYVEEEFNATDESPYVSLQKALKRFAAAEQSREKSRLIQFGVYRSVRAGHKLGGRPPYGYERALYDSDGKMVQILKDGERKLLSTQHIRLVIGDAAEVAVVRRIFDAFVRKRHSSHTIATHLNTEGVPSPSGRRWKGSTIEQMLVNPNYCGRAHATFQKSSNFAEPVRIVSEQAWEAIVDDATWSAAQEQALVRRRWMRTLAGRFVNESKRDELRTRYRAYFGIFKDTADLADFETQIAHAWDRLKARISETENVVVQPDGTILVNGTLRVGFKAAFPTLTVKRSVAWTFSWEGNENYEVTLAIGFTPPPYVVADQYLVFHNARFLKKACSRKVLLWGHRTSDGRRCAGIADVIDAIRSAARRNNERSDQIFLRAVSGQALINTAQVDRDLGWKMGRSHSIYSRLRRHGVELPPLKKKIGRRINVVCDDCGASRSMIPSNAMLLTSTLCWTCFNVRRRRYRICPDCGDERLQGRGRKATWCRHCAPRHHSRENMQCERSPETGRYVSNDATVGRNKDAEVSARLRELRDSRRTFLGTKCEILLAVATAARRMMRDRKEAFGHQHYLRDETARRVLPSLTWRDPNSGEKCRLIFDATPSWVERTPGLRKPSITSASDGPRWSE